MIWFNSCGDSIGCFFFLCLEMICSSIEWVRFLLFLVLWILKVLLFSINWWIFFSVM